MKFCVFRGGSFNYVAWYLRTSYRDGSEPVVRFRDIGFRLVIVRRRKI